MKRPLWSSHQERDKWLLAAPDKLLADCVLSEFQASGPGGQKRNRKYSAVRLRHTPSGIESVSVAGRSQIANKRDALEKLRRRIALHIRSTEKPRMPERFDISTRNPQYPMFLASLFDTLCSCGFRFKDSAEIIGVTPSVLTRKLKKDPEAWQLAQQWGRALSEEGR
ncbi:MAG: peptide chain release factor-like protein [Victivallales bacterium]|nr:peptide chain release factor-like protein [Victivallales bacterium]